MFVSGNPRVTPEVTRDVCLLARLMAANLYFAQIEDLMFEVEKLFLLYHISEYSFKHIINLFKINCWLDEEAYEIDFYVPFAAVNVAVH